MGGFGSLVRIGLASALTAVAMTFGGVIAEASPYIDPIVEPELSGKSGADYSAEIVPHTYAEYDSVFQKMKMLDWNGADVATSTVLPDGKTLWAFGDTIRQDGSYLPNSFLIQDGKEFSYQYSAGIPDGIRDVYWPMHTWASDKDTVWVASQTVNRNDFNGDFSVTGSALHKMDYVHGQLILNKSCSPERNGVVWGSAILTRGEWTYLYGAESASEDMYGKRMFLSRVPTDNPCKGREYLTEHGWSSSPIGLEDLTPSDLGVSTIFSVDEINGTYVLVTKEAEFLGEYVTVFTAKSPEGPFKKGESKYLPSNDDISRYSATAHPELSEKGTLLVSWNENRTDGIPDPTMYRPRFTAFALDL